MKRLQDVYKDSGIVIRTKAPQVKFILIIIICLLPVIIVNDFVTGDYLNSLLEFIVVIFMVLSLLWLYQGKFMIASILPLIVATAATAGLSVLLPGDSVSQVHSAALYLSAPLFLSLAVSRTERYTAAVSGIAVITIILVSVFKIQPRVFALTGQTVWEKMVVGVVLYLLSSIFAFKIARSNRLAMENIEKVILKNQETITHISEINKKAETNLNTLQLILENYSAVEKSVETIKRDTNTSILSAEELLAGSNQALDAVRNIAEQVHLFHNQVDGQNVIVLETTASVNQMSASLDSVANITATKQKSSETLLGVVESGKKSLDETNKAIRNATSQMSTLLEINQIISDIASQTNLLSMNAAIEAAHAGDQGRGFAVVAEEIRKLAASTSENSKIISENLKNIMQSVTETGNMAVQTSQAMEQITKEVVEVSSAFKEITGSTAELSQGGREIMSAMNKLQDISVSVREGSDRISRDQQSAGEQMEQVGMKVKTIEIATSDVQTAVEQIQQATQRLNTTITESIEESGALNASITRLTETFDQH